MSDTRFIAEWIVRQHIDERGEWEPDRDEREFSTHKTLAEAQEAAIAGAKKAHVVEWCAVEEETYNASLGIPRRSPAAWDSLRTWCGDYEGNWVENRS